MSPDFRLGHPDSMGIRMGESSRNSGMIPLNPLVNVYITMENHHAING